MRLARSVDGKSGIHTAVYTAQLQLCCELPPSAGPPIIVYSLTNAVITTIYREKRIKPFWPEVIEGSDTNHRLPLTTVLVSCTTENETCIRHIKPIPALHFFHNVNFVALCLTISNIINYIIYSI